MSASSLPGYTVLPKASAQLAQRDQNIPSTFEVVDLKTFKTTEIDNSRAVKKRPKKRVAVEEVKVSHEITESLTVVADEPLITDPIGPLGVPGSVGVKATDSVVIITPYTEVEILASEVFVDKTVFSVISPLNDRVKVKPQRGSELKATYNGETYSLYASGVYIPIKCLDSILSIFFVMDENQEEV